MSVNIPFSFFRGTLNIPFLFSDGPRNISEDPRAGELRLRHLPVHRHQRGWQRPGCRTTKGPIKRSVFRGGNTKIFTPEKCTLAYKSKLDILTSSLCLELCNPTWNDCLSKALFKLEKFQLQLQTPYWTELHRWEFSCGRFG